MKDGMQKKNGQEKNGQGGNAAYLALAHKLADEAGKVILPLFRTPLDVENKAKTGFDPVTQADRLAEKVMRRHIEGAHPDHGIFGEEEGQKTGDGEFTWFLDPIDGTRAFMMGSPLWGTLIALSQNRRPILGVVDQPFLNERFWALDSGSAFMRNARTTQPIKTRRCASLADAVLCTTSPDMFAKEDDRTAFMSLSKKVRLTRYGGDCYNYCLLAAGFIDIVIETGLKPYDVQALIPIIKAAGGRFTTWAGESGHNGGQIIACGDARLHDSILEMLA